MDRSERAEDRASAVGDPATTPAATTGPRILVVDDSPTILAVAKKLLSRAGCNVDVAEDWLSANKLFHTPGRRPPDAVLIDVNLGSSMKGDMILDAYLQWRKKGSSDRPGLFLFSEMPEDQLSALAKSCSADGYIAKGPGLGTMIETLQRWLAAHP